MTCVITICDSNENELMKRLVLDEFYTKDMYDHIQKLVAEVKEENPDEWNLDDIIERIGQHYRIADYTHWEVWV